MTPRHSNIFSKSVFKRDSSKLREQSSSRSQNLKSSKKFVQHPRGSLPKSRNAKLPFLKKLNADTEVKYNDIMAEANLIETAIIADSKDMAAKIRAEAEAY